MQVKNTLIKLVVIAAVMIPYASAAQTSSINAFSPYTMYGIGEQNTPGTLPMRSMGGVGVAMRSSGVVNLLNPAAFSAAPQKSFLFNFGLEGQNYYNSQKVDGVSKSTAYNTFNFHDIAFQLPLAKKLGLGFSLTPYSSVGYRTKYTHDYDPSDPVWGNVGRAQYVYQGEGDVTEVKLGVGWELFKNFSLGIAAQYYWGDIDRSFVMTPTPITGDGSYSSTVGTDNYSISSIKGQIGVQWNAILNQKRALTLGAAYDFGGDLNPTVTKNIYVGDLYYSTVKGDTTHLALVLPRQLSVGAFYQTSKWTMGVDYVYQDWRSGNSRLVEKSAAGFDVAYRNTNTVKLGVEYTPNKADVRSALKRWSYRAGVRYGTYNQTFGGVDVNEYAVTLGVGIPLTVLGGILGASSVDLGVEVGGRGSFKAINEQVSLVKQTYCKFSLGVTLFGDYWFVRPKYD